MCWLRNKKNIFMDCTLNKRSGLHLFYCVFATAGKNMSLLRVAYMRLISISYEPQVSAAVGHTVVLFCS